MAYTNSPLVVYKKISPHKNSPRNHAIDTITIHCVEGQVTAESLGDWFAQKSTEASSNYGVDKDGRVGMYVEEKDRSWCTSNRDNDHRAITIEVASEKSGDRAVTDKAYNALIQLVADICKRNNIKKLIWSTSKEDRINHKNGCNMTVHRDYANKVCPGEYLYSRHGEIASKVNAILNPPASSGTMYRVQVGAYTIKANAEKQMSKLAKAGFDTYLVKVDNYYKVQTGAYSVKANADAQLAKVTKAGFDAFITTKGGEPVQTSSTGYKVKITASALNVRMGAGTGYTIVGVVKKGDIYTIVEEKNGWGKLKSGVGWISLNYTTKI